MKSIRITLPNIISLLLIVSAPIFSQIDVTERLRVNPEITIGELDNGMKYYIKENKKPEKRANLWIAVNAGSVLTAVQAASTNKSRKYLL